MRRPGIVSSFPFPSFTYTDGCHSASVNVFYRANQECSANHVTQDPERMKQEREFKMGSIGLADSFGIMLAAVLAVPTEIRLCRAQVRRGKTLCQGL
jgi:battenin